jgi:hypothetical protein
VGLDGADSLPLVTDLAGDERWGRLPDLAEGPGLKEVSVGRLWGFPSRFYNSKNYRIFWEGTSGYQPLIGMN